MSPFYNECHYGMVWNFDPSIHNRLERILARWQHRSLGKQSIRNDRSSGTEQSVNHDDHSSISGSGVAARHVQMWYDCQWGELKVMLQSLCMTWPTQCIHINHAGLCFRFGDSCRYFIWRCCWLKGLNIVDWLLIIIDPSVTTKLFLLCASTNDGCQWTHTTSMT